MPLHYKENRTCPAYALGLGDFLGTAYYRTRKQLIEEKSGMAASARKEMTDTAQRYMSTILDAADRKTLDRQCLRAQTFFDREELKHFTTELFRARAHRLAQFGTSTDLAEAFQNSVNVLIASIANGSECAVEAAVWQTGWAIQLGISKWQFVRHYKATQQWLIKKHDLASQRRLLTQPLRLVIDRWHHFHRNGQGVKELQRD